MNDRRKMAEIILGYEARVDSQGHLQVYKLPKDDGGGTYEVAGVNDRYHPKEFKTLADLIRQKKYDQAKYVAISFMAEYTDVAGAWHPDPAVRFFLRDCVFNRGPRGAAIIYQKAVGADIDGMVGPKTILAGNKFKAEELIPMLRSAREWYERVYAHRDEHNHLWKGLVNRWNKAVKDANKFL